MLRVLEDSVGLPLQMEWFPAFDDFCFAVGGGMEGGGGGVGGAEATGGGVDGGAEAAVSLFCIASLASNIISASSGSSPNFSAFFRTISLSLSVTTPSASAK